MGDRTEIGRGWSAANDLLSTLGLLLLSLRQEPHDHAQQQLQRLAVRGRLARPVDGEDEGKRDADHSTDWRGAWGDGSRDRSGATGERAASRADTARARQIRRAAVSRPAPRLRRVEALLGAVRRNPGAGDPRP